MNKSSGGTGLGMCVWHARYGTLSPPGKMSPEISVGAACMHPTLPVLYCTDECSTLPGYFRGGGGQVYALAVDRQRGGLTEINHTPSFGSLPSFLTVDAGGEYLIVTHHTGRDPATRIAGDKAGEYRILLDYDDATTVLFPLNPDGSIAPPCDVYKHTGGGGPLPRQTHPQLHSVTRSPSGNIFVVCDKGNDELVVFGIDRAERRLEVRGSGMKTLPGSSPRYTAFHPVQPYVFLNHETKGIVTSIVYREDGTLLPVCTVSALPEDCPDGPEVKQSDLKVHPNGKFLYTLIRGLDLVSVYEIDQSTGLLERTQTVAVRGHGPRGCAISPDGRYMLIAGLTSHQVSVWEIASDGTLSSSASGVDWKNAGSVTFV